MELTVDSRQENGRTVVDVAGELDLHTAPQLREALTEAIAGGQSELVVDLNGLEFIDSTGLGMLVSAHRQMTDAGGSLRLVCTQPRVLRVMEITNTTSLFEIHDSLPDPLNAG